jgi:hypothetical protein
MGLRSFVPRLVLVESSQVFDLERRFNRNRVPLTHCWFAMILIQSAHEYSSTDRETGEGHGWTGSHRIRAHGRFRGGRSRCDHARCGEFNQYDLFFNFVGDDGRRIAELERSAASLPAGTHRP